MYRMNQSKKQNFTDWFYLKHLSTGKVISTSQLFKSSQVDDYLRSQVLVTEQKFTDNELWCWDDNYLRNRLTGLVLDIRKGRLRLTKDTEICLYYKKTYELSNNQLWAVRPAAGSESTTATDHPLTRRNVEQSARGKVIYSICNSDWVLDVCCPGEHSSNCKQKLVLFPQHHHNSKSQLWDIIPENCARINEDLLTPEDPGLIFDTNVFDSSIRNENSFGYARTSSSTSLESLGVAHGLSPAKRPSQSSLNSLSRKQSAGDVHIYQSSQHFQIYP